MGCRRTCRPESEALCEERSGLVVDILAECSSMVVWCNHRTAPVWWSSSDCMVG